MAKPVPGKPDVDAQGKELLKQLILLNAKFWKNLDSKTLRDLACYLTMRGADANRYCHIRAEQSQGGQKGAKLAAEKCAED